MSQGTVKLRVCVVDVDVPLVVLSLMLVADLLVALSLRLDVVREVEDSVVEVDVLVVIPTQTLR